MYQQYTFEKWNKKFLLQYIKKIKYLGLREDVQDSYTENLKYLIREVSEDLTQYC